MNQNKLHADRLNKLNRIRELGIDPFGQSFNYESILNCKHAVDGVRTGSDTGPEHFSVAGRIVLHRQMGNLVFLTVRDQTGDIQFGISKKDLSTNWELIKLIDLGDIVGARGTVGRTQKGEITLWVTEFYILSKSLLPPPEKWHGLNDPELKYRQRYLSMSSDPDVLNTFKLRHVITKYIRTRLYDKKFIEVETPILQPLYGGAAAKPFITHHNKLDCDLYLRISPELYLKRCLIGGLEKVFEISKSFRNEGISYKHNPEFTMLEAYQAYADYLDMRHLVNELISGLSTLLQLLTGCEPLEFNGNTIDYTSNWNTFTYNDLFCRFFDCSIFDEDKIRCIAERNGEINLQQNHWLIVNDLFEKQIEHTLIQPTFVMDYPAELCPLTKPCKNDPRLAQRFELYIGGMEIANSYTELNDPILQRQNFEKQLQGEHETMRVLDEDFLTAMSHGMPPCAGIGIGLDRLCMLLLNKTNIKDIILFPTMKSILK